MATLRDVSIQPVDLILFRGIDPVSRAICFIEGKRFGHGDFSHAGIAELVIPGYSADGGKVA